MGPPQLSLPSRLTCSANDQDVPAGGAPHHRGPPWERHSLAACRTANVPFCKGSSHQPTPHPHTPCAGPTGSIQKRRGVVSIRKLLPPARSVTTHIHPHAHHDTRAAPRHAGTPARCARRERGERKYYAGRQPPRGPPAASYPPPAHNPFQGARPPKKRTERLGAKHKRRRRWRPAIVPRRDHWPPDRRRAWPRPRRRGLVSGVHRPGARRARGLGGWEKHRLLPARPPSSTAPPPPRPLDERKEDEERKKKEKKGRKGRKKYIGRGALVWNPKVPPVPRQGRQRPRCWRHPETGGGSGRW